MTMGATIWPSAPRQRPTREPRGRRSDVLFGSASGLTGSGAVVLNQTAGAPGVSEEGDRFGSALATGDTDGDGHDDLSRGQRRRG